MKRVLIILISIIMLATSAFAKIYAPVHKRIQVEIPDNYTVVTRSTDKNAPEWDVIYNKRGKTAEEIVKLMQRNNSYLYAINDNGIRINMTINRREDASDDFRYLKQEALWAYAQYKKESSNFKSYREKWGETIDSGIIRHSQTPILKTHSIFEGKWLITYEVIWQANWYTFYIFFDDEKITPEQESEVVDIIQNLVFEDAGLEKTGESELFAELLDRYPDPEEPSSLMSAKSAYERYIAKKVWFWVTFSGIALLLIAVILTIVWLILRKRRKEKERDDMCMAKAKDLCIVCKAPIPENAEVCPSCGTRQ